MHANRNFANVNFFIMVRIGVVGALELGERYIQCIQNIPGFSLVGFVEEDDSYSQKIEKSYGIRRFSNHEVFMEQVDALVLLHSSQSNFYWASRAIKASKHVFIQPPLTRTAEEAKDLLELAYEGNVIIQVGQSAQFNPGLQKALQMELKPVFIEAHYQVKSQTIQHQSNIVLELMLQDIAIVLGLIRSNVKRIEAFGLNPSQQLPEMVNARIEFDNGCVANLTASRIAEKEEHRMRLFQNASTVNIDFIKQHSEIRYYSEIGEQNALESGHYQAEASPKNEEQKDETAQIYQELISFESCINSNLQPVSSVQEGYNALNIAFQIMEKIQSKANIR